MSRWKKVKIGDLLTRYKEPVEVRDNLLYKRVTIRTKHKGVEIRDEEIGKKIGTKKQWLVKEGQFILSRIDARFGAMGMIPKEVDGAIVTNDFLAFDVNKNTIEQYLFYQLLKSPIFLEACKKASRGVTQRKRINEDFFLGYELTIPSRDAQKELCAKIELAEKGQETLKDQIESQKTNLKNLRKQILQDAIEGKLTKEWRENNPDIEPASELLKRIKQEKENLIAEKKIKKEKPLPSIIESEAASGLPFGWSYERLGNFCLNMDDKRIPISKSLRIGINKIYDYYGASGVIDKIDGFTHEGDHLLIGEDGANLVSRSTPIAFVASGKFWVNNHAHVLRFFNPESLLYVKNFINAISLDRYITGGFQPKLNQFNLNRILLFVPPLNEQRVIVNKLKELMQKLDEAEKQIEKSLETSKLLTKTILAEAFKSEV